MPPHRWTKESRPAGRKPGAKSRVSLTGVREVLSSIPRKMYRDAIVRGLKSPDPRHAAPYVELAARYLDGLPVQQVQATVEHRMYVLPPDAVIDMRPLPASQDAPDTFAPHNPTPIEKSEGRQTRTLSLSPAFTKESGEVT